METAGMGKTHWRHYGIWLGPRDCKTGAGDMLADYYREPASTSVAWDVLPSIGQWPSPCLDTVHISTSCRTRPTADLSANHWGPRDNSSTASQVLNTLPGDHRSSNTAQPAE